MNEFIVDTSDTYYIDTIYKDMDSIANRYKGLIHRIQIGSSVEDRPVYAFSHGRCDGLRPSLLLTGGIHAREDYSVMLVMKMLDRYLYHLSKNLPFGGFDVKDIFAHTDICFIPLANPDGLNIVHYGIKASQNYDTLRNMKIWGADHTYWKANARGVDLNKNFDDGNWQIRKCVPGTDIPCSDRYKGPFPNSEPEVQALVNWCNSHQFHLMISYHCSGNCVFWADEGTHGLFGGMDERIIDEFSSKYIYKKTRISSDPSIYGCGFENWFRAKKKMPAFCIELSPYNEGGRQNPDSLFDDLVWQHSDTTGLFFAQKAADIYRETACYVSDEAALTGRIS